MQDTSKLLCHMECLEDKQEREDERMAWIMRDYRRYLFSHQWLCDQHPKGAQCWLFDLGGEWEEGNPPQVHKSDEWFQFKTERTPRSRRTSPCRIKKMGNSNKQKFCTYCNPHLAKRMVESKELKRTIHEHTETFVKRQQKIIQCHAMDVHEQIGN
jgi:hypothetical protein